MISIHTTAKVMTLIILCIRNLCQVSIYTTAKVMTSTDIRQYRTNYISIHTTAKVVTPPESGTSFPIEYFNPHHREGGDNDLYNNILGGWNFNPHHREGGDSSTPRVYSWIFDFNPHHREGGDPSLLCGSSQITISIHTTAKVVTGFKVTGVRHPQNFNPHHREGGDKLGGDNNQDGVLFQSTPPRRW